MSDALEFTKEEPIAEPLQPIEKKPKLTPEQKRDKELARKKKYREKIKAEKQTKRADTPAGQDQGENKDPEPQGKGLDNLLGEYEEVKEQPQTEAQVKVTDGEGKTIKPIISGYMFLIAVDSFFPGIVLGLVKMVNKRARGIDAAAIKLTPGQRTTLEPVADEAAAYIFKGMHPLAAFAISMGFIYFGNINLAIEKLPKK